MPWKEGSVPMDKTPLLQVRDLKIDFPGARGTIHAVRGVSYDVYPGEILGIVGESGSGKSVSAYSLMRLLPPSARIMRGEALFEDQDLLRMEQRALEQLRGRDLAMIFQDPLSSLDPCFTVGRQLTETLRAHELHGGADAAETALAMLTSVGIRNAEQVMRQYPFELSGGMRQRIMIAMALLCKPRLLIADEPTTALDVTIQDQILRLLRKLQAEHGTSMVFITHNFGIVAQLCDRVLVMYGGRVVERGTVRQVFDAPSHPYTRALLQAIPRMEDDRTVELPTIPGAPLDPYSEPEGCAFAPRCAYAGAQCRQLPTELELGDGHCAACWMAGRLGGASAK